MKLPISTLLYPLIFTFFFLISLKNQIKYVFLQKIPKCTFNNWRNIIWDMFGIDISNENCGEYRYYK